MKPNPPLVVYANDDSKPVVGTGSFGDCLNSQIPGGWLEKAAALPGKAFTLGITLWFQAGRDGSTTVQVDALVIKRFNISRHSMYRSLKALEEAGLIVVRRSPNTTPEVTIRG